MFHALRAGKVAWHEEMSAVSEMVSTGADALSDACERTAWRLLLKGCQWSGPAAIKWAQWSSCRPDVFPVNMCDVLAQMHDDAPAHRWMHTAKELQAAFGRHLEDLFVTIDREPLASGSIAQVLPHSR
jgi:predicted unusual protein kinase regulating ubiquinone biosynthesis (AarF/ABC1/UbiB family)